MNDTHKHWVSANISASHMNGKRCALGCPFRYMKSNDTWTHDASLDEAYARLQVKLAAYKDSDSSTEEISETDTSARKASPAKFLTEEQKVEVLRCFFIGGSENGVVALAKRLNVAPPVVSAHVKANGGVVRRGAAPGSRGPREPKATVNAVRAPRAVREAKPEVALLDKSVLLELGKRHYEKAEPISKFAGEFNMNPQDLAKQLVTIGVTPRRGNPTHWKPIPYQFA